MKHFYEVFISSQEDWMNSSIMINVSHKKKGKRKGKHVWKKFEELVQQ